MGMAKWLKDEKKERIARRDGGARCHYCGKRLKLRFLTLDHVVPVSKGGSNSLSNLVLACHDCNMYKGNTDYKDYCGVEYNG